MSIHIKKYCKKDYKILMHNCSVSMHSPIHETHVSKLHISVTTHVIPNPCGK